MVRRVYLPVKEIGGDLWAEISATGPSVSHEICGEQVKLSNSRFSFAGGHRVQLFKFKKNVHWKIPSGVTLDISDVTPAVAPRRQTGR